MEEDSKKSVYGRAVNKPCPHCGQLKCTVCGGKYCTKCSEWKPYSSFDRAAALYDGYQTQCKICRRSMSMIYLANGGREHRKQYRAEHREKDRAYNKRWRDAHKEEHYQRTRKYAIEHFSTDDRKNALLKTRYGITKADYDRMVEEQHGACKICGKAAKLVVDHAHDETGRVRGLLCKQCNSGLGHFQENIATVLAAVTYIQSDGEFERQACQVAYRVYDERDAGETL